MKILKIMMCTTITILLLGLIGCGAAPSADSKDVKNLVVDICRRPGALAKFGIENSYEIKLRAIRTISVDKTIRKTTAQAELLVHLAIRPEPLVYQVVYTAQYTSDGELYVTVLEAR
jgi:hypothetical protein